MDKDIIYLWEENKDKLRHVLENTRQELYSEYDKLLKTLCLVCFEDIDIDKIHTIRISEYQGDYVFIMPKKETYNLGDVYIVSVGYGSCSGCDTLLGIQDYCDLDTYPNEKQLRDYMMLCLHIVQNIKSLDDIYKVKFV